jgi:aldehyde dehydrogenase (NAD+)
MTLDRSPLEGFLTELALVKAEIETALQHLDEWMTPKKTRNSALNIPSWSTTQRDPLGVVLIMGAWNYPMQLSLAPLVGAIAGGNCVVVKPGSYAIDSSHALARAISKHLDNSCIKVVEGNREMTNALLNETFETTFFTGSAFVGKIVAQAAASHLRPCVLELGGKSPTIVDKSANLEHAAQRLIWGTFINGGQTCVRPDFVMVHEDVADAFFKLCKRFVKEFYGEDAQQSEWFGRCINTGAFTR